MARFCKAFIIPNLSASTPTFSSSSAASSNAADQPDSRRPKRYIMESCAGGSSSPRCANNGKQVCLCAPTTHVGSFRCRFHRSSSFSKLDRASSSLSAPTNTSPNPTPSSDTQCQ
ncbi:hypothetical protein GOP47_0011460 [Adiantum capillus-veneris]|uniref:Uncharacterized protein n=1 Tax=Adiantum capillus-veneris TaxID=13818 RepID=A0A9D4ZGS0_ADICA|nr:hypothetical protein GOP47_0011460 [Adiantum capillus-veneris]